jgi:hypothetical protein
MKFFLSHRDIYLILIAVPIRFISAIEPHKNRRWIFFDFFAEHNALGAHSSFSSFGNDA